MEGSLIIGETTQVPVVFSVLPGGRKGRVLLPTGLQSLLRLYGEDEAVLLRSKAWQARVSIRGTSDLAESRPWFRFQVVEAV